MHRRLLILVIYACGFLLARGQSMPEVDLTRLHQATQTQSINYWFDGEASKMQTVSTLSGTITIDASTMLEGMHTLHFQLVDTEGKAASVGSSLFYRANVNSASTAKSLRYWFDGNGNDILPAGNDAFAVLIGAHCNRGAVHFQRNGMCVRTGERTGCFSFPARTEPNAGQVAGSNCKIYPRITLQRWRKHGI